MSDQHEGCRFHERHLTAERDEALKQVEFYKRSSRDFEEAIDNVRAALGLQSTHYLVIGQQVQAYVDALTALRHEKSTTFPNGCWCDMTFNPNMSDHSPACKLAQQAFEKE